MNICSDSRVRNRIPPIQMKRGSAASSQLAVVSQKAVNRFLPGSVLVKNACPTQPTMASDIEIHTPPASSTSSTSSKRPPMATTDIQSSSEKSPRAWRSSSRRT